MFEAVRKIRILAKSEHSVQLEQVASRVASAMHVEVSNSDDLFGQCEGLDQLHDREVGRRGVGGCQPETCEFEKVSFFNRHTDCQVCAAHKRGCRIADNTRRVGSQAAVTKLHAEEKDPLSKNGIESALRWVFCTTTRGGDRAHEAAGEKSTKTIGLLQVGRL